MKVITKQGIDTFNKTFDTKLAQGKVDSLYLAFRASSPEAVKKIIWKCRDRRAEYDLQHETILVLHQKELKKILPEECFEDVRAWVGKDNITPVSKMDHQRLSNCVGYLEMLLVLNKISQKNSLDYMKKLQESVVPELDERFNGVILPYVPFYEFEKSLYQDYLKAVKK